MPVDAYTAKGLVPDITEPAVHAFAITPNNDVDLAYVTRAIYVGVTGDVKVTTLGGETVTYKNLAAGVKHEGRYVRVFATGTTATDIIGEY